MSKAAPESNVIRFVRETLARAEGRREGVSRPTVTLSFAQSLDGCISARAGVPTPISNDQSMLITHQLRAMHGAILVGINTVLVDNPSLTVRYAQGESPLPVVLDSRLRTPPNAKLLAHSDKRPIIATREDASAEREARLVDAGARVVRVGADEDGGLRLVELFRWLYENGIRSLMIEGGAKVISSVLAHGLSDQIVLTIAPKFFGREGVRAVESLNCLRLGARPCLAEVKYEQLGDNLVVWGCLDREDAVATTA